MSDDWEASRLPGQRWSGPRRVLLDRALFSRLLLVGKPFFVSRARWRARGALAIIVAMLVALNALNVANSYVGRNFMTAIALRHHGLFVRYAALYLAVFAASAVVSVTAQFLQDRLGVTWRHWLTRQVLRRYLAGRTSEVIGATDEIDNPDQRITEDIRSFASTLLSFFVMLTNACLTTVAFVGVLWSIRPVLLFTAVTYAVLGSLLTVLLGRRLVGLNHLQLRKEADLRLRIIRARERVEASRTPRADERTARLVFGQVRRVVGNSLAIIRVSRNVGFFTSGYNYLIPLLPMLLVAPSYLRGEVELGVVTQAAMAFAQILGALSLIVAQFQSVAACAAVVHRIGSLWEAMDAVADARVSLG